MSMIGSTVALICSPVRRAILAAVSAECDRQDAKWGGVPGSERRDDHTYAAVLGEEFGECCKAWLERDMVALREELIQTAAVAIAWVEELDNGGALPRPALAPDREANELMSIAYGQALEDARTSTSSCFANCGAPACQKLGCVRVYNDRHREERA